MFPKESFTGQDKKKAKSHWAEFSKYLDYQDQHGTILRDLAHLPEIKSMFKLTLQDIALGWFETESPTWLTEDQMKQAFLKRFNPWGDTRCQQQDAWNKLKFDMTKDDVDAFVVDMKMLASILGHNDDVITEKFKDIFPDPNIEAALIAMDDFAAMQTKAKQLVQIYKPAHDSPMASAAILVHNAGNTPTKGKSNRGRRWDNSRGQGHSDQGRGRRWNPNQQYHDPGYQQQTQFANPNHYRPPPMGHQYRYPIPYEQYSYPQQQQYQSQMPPAPSQQATNICQLCQSQGHYDYQCQFAGDFMACTQKAFNQG